MTTINALNSSVSVEWYTPAPYVEAARNVLGGIDLDPASCSEANEVIQAGCYYTQENRFRKGACFCCGTLSVAPHLCATVCVADALTETWKGRVFLNPPYGRDAQRAWSDKLLREYSSGNVGAAILLVNACTSEKWFAPLWRFPICFTDHRIKFNSPGAVVGSPGENGGSVRGEIEGSASAAAAKRGPTKGSAFVFLPDNAEFIDQPTTTAADPQPLSTDHWQSDPQIASFIGEFSKFGFIYLPNALALSMREVHKSRSREIGAGSRGKAKAA